MVARSASSQQSDNVEQAVRSLAVGETTTVNTDMGQVTITNTQEGLEASGGLQQAQGFCTYTLTSLIFALGAGALAFMAASGGAVIGGIFFDPTALAQLAAISGSFSALYAFIGSTVC